MPAMSFDDLADQVQAEAGSGRARPQAVERLEHTLALFGWNARAVVLYLERRSQHADRHMTSAMFDRVLNQICQPA